MRAFNIIPKTRNIDRKTWKYLDGILRSKQAEIMSEGRKVMEDMVVYGTGACRVTENGIKHIPGKKLK